MKRLAILFIAFGLPLAAHAQLGSQQFSISTPGQFTTYYTPNPISGGGTFNTPGQPPTYYRPNPFGSGGELDTPGQPPIYIQKTPSIGDN